MTKYYCYLRFLILFSIETEKDAFSLLHFTFINFIFTILHIDY